MFLWDIEAHAARRVSGCMQCAGRHATDGDAVPVLQQDIELGTVKSLLETGANDVLVVTEETEQGSKERLIPWTIDQAVISVDLKKGVIEVDWDPDF